MGHDVSIISLIHEPVISPTSASVNIFSLNMKKTPFGLVRALVHARTIAQKIQPDVVHSHMIHANLFARLLRIIAPIKRLICTAHSTNEGGSLRMLGYRVTDFLSDLNTNVSKEAVDCFIQKKASNSKKMIPMLNGINTRKFIFNNHGREKIRAELNIKNECFLFLSVGRLSEEKDYPNLLNAYSLVVSEYPNALLAIVGKGELEDKLISLAEKLQIRDKVFFLGLRRDIPDLMSAGDCFVLPSKYEGFGLVVAEAMLCECLVVATNCGGVAEVLAGNGFLVEPCNSLALAESMLKAINLSKESKNECVKNAKNHILSFCSLDAIAIEWIEIYQGNRP